MKSEERPIVSAAGAADHAWMIDEARAVAASSDFARAPTMSRLLEYLVVETIEGRGAQLKGYAVAVDGLGRAPDFDARADSYPRVQVGRLRKMLGHYYEAHPPQDGRVLIIPTGRYQVDIGRGDALTPLIGDEETESASDRRENTRRSMTAPLPMPVGVLLLVLLLVTLSIAGAMLVSHMVVPAKPAPPRVIAPPMLELRMEPSGDRVSAEMTLMVRAALLDGLQRSWLFQTRVLRRSGEPDPAAQPAQYRLATELADGQQPELYLRLWHLGPDRLIWSDRIRLPTGDMWREGLGPKFDQIMAAIGQSHGLIATAERSKYAGTPRLGYTCLLDFERFRYERRRELFAPVMACVEQSLWRDRSNGLMHAAASMLQFDSIFLKTAKDPKRAMAAARYHARQAIAFDPFGALSVEAGARIALYDGQCPVAVRRMLRAKALNPFDSALALDVGIVLLNCDDPRAEAEIRRGIALEQDPVDRYYLPLIFVAAYHNDPQLARATLAELSQSTAPGTQNYNFSIAVGNAVAGDYRAARSAWAKLQRTNPEKARDPAAELSFVRATPKVIDRTLAALKRAGVIENGSAAPGKVIPKK